MRVIDTFVAWIKGLDSVSEDEIENEFTVNLKARNEAGALSWPIRIRYFVYRLRRGLSVISYQTALHLVGANATSVPFSSDKPCAHSSASISDGFARVKSIFKPPDYSVYRIANRCQYLEPLIGPDTIVVFEQVSERVVQKQPLERGDLVTILDGDRRLLGRIKHLDKDGHSFRIGSNELFSKSALEGRLVAVFYFQSRGQGDDERIGDVRISREELYVDIANEETLVSTGSDKPTPHSSVGKGGKEIRMFMFSESS